MTKPPDVLRLPPRRAAEYLADHNVKMHPLVQEQVHDYVASYWGPLARGTVFVAVPGHQGPPAVFVAQVAGHRTHVLVAREYGDVSWPAWLDLQRKHAVGDAVLTVRQGMQSVTDWIAASERELAQRWRMNVVADDTVDPETVLLLGHDPVTGGLSPERSTVLRGIA